MRWKIMLSRRAISTLLAPLVATSMIATAYEQSNTLSADDGRPLAKIVRMLEERSGVAITYEDPPYVHNSQIADVTDRVAKTRSADRPRIHVPRGGPFDFTSTSPSDEPQPQMRPMLERLVTEYRTAGYGDFKIERAGDMFHVVPRTFRNRGGADEAYAPVLSIKIMMNRTGTRSALEVLEETMAMVTRATGIPVVLGTIPATALANSPMAISAANESARSILRRTLAATETATGVKLSWALYYSPEQQPRYFLNIHGVPPTKADRSGAAGTVR